MHKTESITFRPTAVAVTLGAAIIATVGVFFLLHPATGRAGYRAPSSTTVVGSTRSRMRSTSAGPAWWWMGAAVAPRCQQAR